MEQVGSNTAFGDLDLRSAAVGAWNKKLDQRREPVDEWNQIFTKIENDWNETETVIVGNQSAQINGRSFYKVLGLTLVGIAAFVAIRAVAKNWDAIKAAGNKAVAYAKESRIRQYIAPSKAAKKVSTVAAKPTAAPFVMFRNIKHVRGQLPTNKPICTRPGIVGRR